LSLGRTLFTLDIQLGLLKHYASATLDKLTLVPPNSSLVNAWLMCVEAVQTMRQTNFNLNQALVTLQCSCV
jgi:hypothetical protein